MTRKHRFVPGESFAESRPAWAVPSGLEASGFGSGSGPGKGSNPPQFHGGYHNQDEEEEWLGWGTSQPRIRAQSSTTTWTSRFDWEADGDENANIADAQSQVVDPAQLLFTDDVLQNWTSQEALAWISKASSEFEVLGLQASGRPFNALSMLRKRFRKLSLLTHPDKNPEPLAADAFRKLSDAMRVLCDEDEQAKLIKKLFPAGASSTISFLGSRGPKVEPPPPPRPPPPPKTEEEEEEERLKAEVREKEQLEKADAEWRRRREGLHSFYGRSKPYGNVSAPTKEPTTKKRRQNDQPSWGLPQAFQPPAQSPSSSSGGYARPAGPSAATSAAVSAGGKAASSDVNPHLVWELTGAIGLANNGWERLESSRHPGHFYYLHKASGRTVVAPKDKPKKPASSASASQRESRSRPGTFYFVNRRTGETSLTRPQSAPTTASHGEVQDATATVAATRQDSKANAQIDNARSDLSEGESELGDEQPSQASSVAGNGDGQNFLGRHVVYGLSATSCHLESM